MDYSRLTYAKPRARLLEKRERAAALKAEDLRQRKLCHLRSGGRCEIIVAHFTPEQSELSYDRCKGRVTQNHHLKGGHGRRNVGDSILACHRLDVCNRCHAEINAGLLQPLFTDDAMRHSAALVRFERRS